MGNDAVDPGDRRARAWELSEELRRIVEALAVCDVAPDQLDAATRLARELRSRLGGPRGLAGTMRTRIPGPWAPNPAAPTSSRVRSAAGTIRSPRPSSWTPSNAKGETTV